MKILIAGAGKVGTSLTEQLSLEGYDITIIDMKAKRLEMIMETYDVITMEGNSAASNVLKESLVTYCDEAKMNRLFVDPETIKKHSAVSFECAKEMAEGVIRATGCDVGVATTGYAGPDGEEAGHIFFAVSFKDKTVVKEMNLAFDRNLVREAAVIRVLALVHQILKET